MSIERGLLADIHEHPDDDALRLILADWLEDQSDPVLRARGEFVRLQCRLAADPLDSSLRAQVEGLQARHAAAWLGPLAGHARNVLFHRGLARLVMVGPRVTPVSLRVLAALPGLDHVDGLILRDVSPDAMMTLLDLPFLRNLELFVFHMTPVPASVWSALARSPHLGNLRRLRLHLNQFGADGMKLVAGAAGLRKLVELNVSGNDITDNGLIELARSPILGQVQHLDLRNNRLHNQGVCALARSRHLGNLRWLALEHNFIGDEGIRALAASQGLPHLIRLGLVANDGGPEGAWSLIRSPHLNSIQWLTYDESSLDTACQEALRKRFWCRG